MKQSMKYLAAAALLTGVFWNATAFAGAQSNPGSECVKWRASDPQPYLSYSGIYNDSSSSWLRVDCPVDRTDFDGFLHDAAVESSWVRVVDQNFNSNVRCQLVSYSRNGSGSNSVWSTGNRFSSGTNAGAQQLSFGNLSGENGASHLYFSCHIPPKYSGQRSGIITYHAQQ